MKKLVLDNINASSEKNIFEIPVRWQMRTILRVSADSLKTAIQRVNRQEYDLPDGNYVDDTFEIDYDRLENS